MNHVSFPSFSVQQGMNPSVASMLPHTSAMNGQQGGLQNGPMNGSMNGSMGGPQSAEPQQLHTQQIRSQITHLITICSDSRNPTPQLNQLAQILLTVADRLTVRIFYGYITNLGTDQTKRLWLCELMEKLCLKYCELTPTSLSSLKIMLEQNPNPKLFKRIIMSLRTILPKSLFFLVDKNLIDEVEMDTQSMEDFWTLIQNVAESAIRLGLIHNNDSIKLYTIKLVETLVISLSNAPEKRLYFVTPHSKAKWCWNDEDFRLGAIPSGHPVLKAEELLKKGNAYFGIILDVMTRQETSYTCVTAILHSLLNIAKCRPEYWNRIISSLSTFLEAHPESFTKSQILSIRFELKAIFLFLLKMPQIWQYREQIEEFLKSVNVNSKLIASFCKITDSIKEPDDSEIEEPQQTFSRKRAAEDQLQRSAKMRRIGEKDVPQTKSAMKDISEIRQAITTISTPIGNFQPLELADVIINNLLSINLPTVTVPHGTIDYTLLSDTIMKSISKTDIPVEDMRQLQRFLNPLPQRVEDATIHVAEESAADGIKQDSEKLKAPVSQLVKEFKAKVTFLDKDEKVELANMTWNQVLESENDVIREGDAAIALRTRILIDMVSSQISTNEWREELLSHIKERLDTRYHIAMQWLYYEYVKWVEANNDSTEQEMDSNSTYMTLFKSFLEHIIEISQFIVDTTDPIYTLFQDFVLEAPIITSKTIAYAHKFVLSPRKEIAKIKLGLATLRDLILYRDSVRNECLQALLQYAVSNYHEARENSVVLIRNQLYNLEDFASTIEAFASEKLLLLTQQAPPPQIELNFASELDETPEKLEELEDEEMRDEEEILADEEDEDILNSPSVLMDTKMDEEQQNEEEGEKEVGHVEWSSSTARQYSLLYVALCTRKHELIRNLVNTYICVPGTDFQEPKLTLITQMEQLVSKIGAESKPVLDFLLTYHLDPVETPEQLKEKDALIRRFVNILLESSGETISIDLVQTIKDMFFKRKEDERDAKLLVPIITTLSADEIISSLPWILMLEDEKLLHTALSSTWKFQSSNANPITPLTLLVELHKVEETKNLSLAKIVGAILYCLKQKAVFNSELIASSLSTLIHLPKTPVPLMRTIIECILKNIQKPLIMNLLKILVEQKKIYKEDILWEGLKRVFQITSGTLIYEKALFLLPRDKMKEVLPLPKKSSDKLVLDFVEEYLRKQEHRTSEQLTTVRECVDEIRMEIAEKERIKKIENEKEVPKEDSMEDT